MKFNQTYLFTLILVCGTSFIANAQWTFPTDCDPTPVSNESASNEAKTSSEACGFGSVFFHRKDVEELMDLKSCVGLRFYIAAERPDQRYADVIAVAINANGKEIAKFLERKYHLAKSLDAHYPHEFEKMDKYKAKSKVFMLMQGSLKLDPYVGYIGIERIQWLLKDNDAEGIRIYPAMYEKEGKDYRTMSFGAVRLDDKQVLDLENDYLEGRLPCPVDCGGDGDKNYLWNR